jgi:hypothetical protein
MRMISIAILLTGSCAAPIAAEGDRRIDNHSYQWVNATNGEAIILRADSYTMGGRSYQLRDCSDATRLCVESDGPINLIVYRTCGDQSSSQIGEHRTLIWSVDHHTPRLFLRDLRSAQLLFEYSYRDGVTAIYYSPAGLGMTESTGPDFSQIGRYRYTRRAAAPYLPCSH